MIPTHAQALIDGLETHGWRLETTRRVEGQPFTYAVFSEVPGFGRGCPDKVIPKLAVPLPDDVQIPPPGFHMHPALGLGTVTNTGESPLSLPNEPWVYWSRPLANWAHQPNAARIVSHFNSTLRDA
jgi:hypothetical protein